MGRRGHGEGTIYWRQPKQLWCCQVRLENGRRKTLYGKTRQEVQRKLLQLQRDMEDGLSAAAKRQRVGKYLTSWLETKRDSVERTTWERYERDIRLHLIPAIGRCDLSKLSAQDVQACYSERLRKGAATRSVRHMHAVLHAALDDALALGLVVRNVSQVVKKPTIRRTELPIMSPDDVERFRQVIAGLRLEALYVLTLATGMRSGELLALRWRDVDLARGTVSVTANQKCITIDHHQHWIVGEVKTPSSRRLIRIAEIGAEDQSTVLTLLRAHRTSQLAERMRAGPAWTDGDWVFRNEIGQRYTGYQNWWHFRRLLQGAGLPPVRFHALRHTAATLMLLHNVPVKVVSEILGHSSIAITLNLYGHILPDMQSHAAGVMNRLLTRQVDA